MNGISTVRIIVAFGDIRDFSNFWNAVTHEESELLPFLDRYDDAIDEESHRSGYVFRDAGDGFMCVVELGSGHNCKTALHLLSALWRVHKRVQRIIETTEYPRPDGFRIRVACGHVIKKVKKDGTVIFRGAHINMAHKLLRVEPKVGIICHESMKQLMSDIQLKKARFKFSKLHTCSPIPDGIQKKDMSALWQLEKVKKGR